MTPRVLARMLLTSTDLLDIVARRSLHDEQTWTERSLSGCGAPVAQTRIGEFPFPLQDGVAYRRESRPPGHPRQLSQLWPRPGSARYICTREESEERVGATGSHLLQRIRLESLLAS